MAKPDDASKKDDTKSKKEEEKKEEESQEYGTTNFSTTKPVDSPKADKNSVLPEFRHAEEWERNLLVGNYNPHKEVETKADVRDIFPKAEPENKLEINRPTKKRPDVRDIFPQAEAKPEEKPENKPQAASRNYAVYFQNTRVAPLYKAHREQTAASVTLGKDEIHKRKHDIKDKIENNLSRDSLDQLTSSMLHTQSPEQASVLMSNHIVKVLKDCKSYYELDNTKQSKRSVEKINSLIQDVEKNKSGYMTNSKLPITSLLNKFHSIEKEERKSGIGRLFGSRDLLSSSLHKLDKKLPDVYDVYIASNRQMKYERK